MVVEIRADKAIKDIKEFGKQLSGKQLALGVSRAINRTMMQGRTVARRVVANTYNIPQKSLAAVDITRSTAASLRSEMKANATPLSMTNFAPKFDTPNRSIRVSKRGVVKVKERQRKRRNPGKGVSIEVFKGSRKVIPYAFMTPNLKPVFARGNYTSSGFVKRRERENVSGNDLPIRSMLTVSVHRSILNPETKTAIRRKVEAVFPVEVERDLRYRLSKIKPKSGMV